MVHADAQLLPTDDIKRVAQQAGVHTGSADDRLMQHRSVGGDQLVSYPSCLDHDDVKLYPESVVECRMPDWRWTNVPNRLQPSGCS